MRLRPEELRAAKSTEENRQIIKIPLTHYELIIISHYIHYRGWL